MALSTDEVLRVAALARLELSPDEVRLFTAQLRQVVEFVDRMGRGGSGNDLSTADGTRTAADVPQPGLALEVFLANAPEHRGPFLVVPRILDAEAPAEDTRRDG
ncbi:MAG: aspartyl/glutamyl-tRNA amidotransferase subunit C [Thermoanaerobaculia bacterium]